MVDGRDDGRTSEDEAVGMEMEVVMAMKLATQMETVVRRRR